MNLISNGLDIVLFIRRRHGGLVTVGYRDQAQTFYHAAVQPSLSFDLLLKRPEFIDQKIQRYAEKKIYDRSQKFRYMKYLNP